MENDANIEVHGLNMDVMNIGVQTGSMIPPKELLNAESPYEWYKKMRENSPIYYDEDRQTWDIFLYDDIQKILSDYKTFSSRTGGGERPVSILGMDPPQHKLYRSIVSQAFTLKEIEKMAPAIEKITDELLDKRVGKEDMDIIQDLAYPLPVIVISQMLGVPAKDRELFKKWSDALVADVDVAAGQTPSELMEEKQRISVELYEYFETVISVREKHPQSDLITALLNARIGEESLDRQDLLTFCLLLLVAGNETTTNLIGNAMVTFLERPDIMESLKSDLNLLPFAIEEVLRFRSPIQSLGRVVAMDTDFQGHQMKQGDRLVVWLGSANRDEQKFDQADQFMINRQPNPHVGFGHGIHLCLGAPLARLEATIALTALLQKMPAMTLSRAVHPLPSSFVFGYESIPVQFETMH